MVHKILQSVEHFGESLIGLNQFEAAHNALLHGNMKEFAKDLSLGLASDALLFLPGAGEIKVADEVGTSISLFEKGARMRRRSQISGLLDELEVAHKGDSRVFEFFRKNVNVLEKHWDNSIQQFNRMTNSERSIFKAHPEFFYNYTFHGDLEEFRNPLFGDFKTGVVDPELAKIKMKPFENRIPPSDENALYLQRMAQTTKSQYPTSPDKVKVIYKKLALKLHPDKGGDAAAFQEMHTRLQPFINLDKPIPSERNLRARTEEEMQQMRELHDQREMSRIKRQRSALEKQMNRSLGENLSSLLKMSRVSSVSSLRTAAYAVNFGLFAPGLAIAGMSVDNSNQ